MTDYSIELKLPLNDGRKISMMGQGVYLSGRGSGTINDIKWAIEAGDRHIDTTSMYGNEREVGQAVRDSGLSRNDFFETSQVLAFNDRILFKMND